MQPFSGHPNTMGCLTQISQLCLGEYIKPGEFLPPCLLVSKTVTFPLLAPHKSVRLPFLVSQHPYLLWLPQIHLVCCHSTGCCVCCCCFFSHKLPMMVFYFPVSATFTRKFRNYRCKEQILTLFWYQN